MHLDAKHLGEWIQQLGFWGGHLAIWAIVFAESGLFFGFFLPGDSLLFTAGFLASVTVPSLGGPLLNIQLLVLGCFICAVLGDSVGYWTGKKFGRGLFKKEDSWFFKKKYLEAAQKFYDKHGKKAIVLARFTPIVRTFAPIVAGIAGMNYRSFITYNLVGGFAWTFGLCYLGYVLGNIIPDVDKYLLPIVAAIIVISLLPSVMHLYQERQQSR
jgi:membrane-associated protein